MHNTRVLKNVGKSNIGHLWTPIATVCIRYKTISISSGVNVFLLKTILWKLLLAALETLLIHTRLDGDTRVPSSTEILAFHFRTLTQFHHTVIINKWYAGRWLSTRLPLLLTNKHQQHCVANKLFIFALSAIGVDVCESLGLWRFTLVPRSVINIRIVLAIDHNWVNMMS